MPKKKNRHQTCQVIFTQPDDGQKNKKSIEQVQEHVHYMVSCWINAKQVVFDGIDQHGQGVIVPHHITGKQGTYVQGTDKWIVNNVFVIIPVNKTVLQARPV